MRFLKLVLGLCAIFAMFMVVIRIYGTFHPDQNDLTALGFDTCGDKPCIYGVIPGVTSWDNAYSMFATRLPSDTQIINDGCFIYFGVEDFDIRGGRNCRVKTPITFMEFELGILGRSSTLVALRPHKILLTDVVAKYGSPCGAYLHQPYLFVTYPNMEIRAVASQTNTYLIDVEDILIQNPPEALDGCHPDSEVFSWHGFATITYYHDRVQKALNTR